jgi:hypothetical protein
LIEFFQNVVALVGSVITILIDTASNIDSINFETSVFNDYFGYARYCMGETLYMLLTTVVLIAVGVTIWSYLLKGIGMLKNLLPW